MNADRMAVAPAKRAQRLPKDQVDPLVVIIADWGTLFATLKVLKATRLSPEWVYRGTLQPGSDELRKSV